MEATKKMAPIMYKSTLVEELLPVNNVSWKEVYAKPATVRSRCKHVFAPHADSQQKAVDRAR